MGTKIFFVLFERLQKYIEVCYRIISLVLFKPIFHLANLFARREAKTRIRQRDWLKLAGEKIRREQVGSVRTFLSVRANKVAKWKIGFKLSAMFDICRYAPILTRTVSVSDFNTG